MGGSDAGRTPVRADIPPDSAPDTRWLSYRELAEILAPTKVESVIRLVRRKGWPKRDSNNGVRVAVPADILADMQASRRKGRASVAPKRNNVPADIPADSGADIPRAMTAFETALAAIRADHDRERADWVRQLAALQADRDKLEVENRELRSRADRAEGMAEGLKAASPAPSGGFAAWWRSVRAAFRP